MISIQSDRPGGYRMRAQEAREKAAIEPDQAARKTLLDNAELWERMAAYDPPSVKSKCLNPPGVRRLRWSDPDGSLPAPQDGRLR
jgi:hypothetical protein